LPAFPPFSVAGASAFSFSVDADAKPKPTAHFYGRMIVNRFDFDIAHDVDTSWTGRDVTVDVKLDLRR
jgi:hypothetical protein